MGRSLDIRRDDRSEEQFKTEVEYGCQKEAIYAKAYELLLNAAGQKCKIEPLCTMQGFYRGSIPDDRADYVIKWEDGRPSQPLAITTNLEHLDFFTVKTHTLEELLKTDGSLLMYARCCKVTVLSDEAIRYGYDRLEHKIYPKYAPNKMAIRFYPDHVAMFIANDMARTNSWSMPAARAYIEENREFLTKPKNQWAA